MHEHSLLLRVTSQEPVTLLLCFGKKMLIGCCSELAVPMHCRIICAHRMLSYSFEPRRLFICLNEQVKVPSEFVKRRPGSQGHSDNIWVDLSWGQASLLFPSVPTSKLHTHSH